MTQAAQSLFRKSGALDLPLDAASITDTLAPADPGRDILLGLFAQAIQSELAAAWLVARSGSALATKTIVEHVLPLEPDPQLARTLKLDFPLLAVYRKGQGNFDERTLSIWQLTQQWGVDYVLGPLSAEDARKLCDVLPAVAKVIVETIERRGHPDYASGALQFFPDTGAFASCRALNYQMGRARFAQADSNDTPIYWAMSMTLETTETDGPRAGSATDLLGMSMGLSVGSAVEGIVADLIVGDTDAIEP